jgi:hypothetical protein
MLRIAELQQAEAHGRCDTPGNLSVLGDQIKALERRPPLASQRNWAAARL